MRRLRLRGAQQHRTPARRSHHPFDQASRGTRDRTTDRSPEPQKITVRSKNVLAERVVVMIAAVGLYAYVLSATVRQRSTG